MIDAVVAAVALRVESLALDLGGVPVPVVMARHPRQEEGVSANTQATVHPGRVPHEFRRFNNLFDLHTYRVRVTVWTPGNQQNTPPEGWSPGEQGNTPAGAAASAWEESITQAFRQKPADLLGLDGLRDCRAETASYIDRAQFKKGWEVQAVEVTLEIVRER